MTRLCVAFDLDDTLYLERDYVRSGFRKVGQWADSRFGARNLFEEAWRHFESWNRHDPLQKAFCEMGIAVCPETLNSILEVYRDHQPELVLLPDAHHCLQQLKTCSHLALITDGSEQRQLAKCSSLGLSAWFDTIIVTGRWGNEYHKPNAKAYKYLESIVGAGNHFVYVADNPEKDFTTPIALGWDTIRIRRPEGLHQGKESDENARPRLELTDMWDLARHITEHARQFGSAGI